jgi:hypothetical protein
MVHPSEFHSQLEQRKIPLTQSHLNGMPTRLCFGLSQRAGAFPLRGERDALPGCSAATSVCRRDFYGGAASFSLFGWVDREFEGKVCKWPLMSKVDLVSAIRAVRFSCYVAGTGRPFSPPLCLAATRDNLFALWNWRHTVSAIRLSSRRLTAAFKRNVEARV